jgi:hypothetical protein
MEDSVPIPDEKEFFDYAKKVADTFHSLIHGSNPSRFLGNLSFRCEHGFPSFRTRDVIYVSQRDIDKRFIDKEGFVAVEPILDNVVNYYGDKKPSVDAPIQVRLYSYYNRLRWGMHSHVYIKNAPMTSIAIPCGAVEEFDEILELFPEGDMENVVVNLRGHGSLAMCSYLGYMKGLQYYARPIPELQSLE